MVTSFPLKEPFFQKNLQFLPLLHSRRKKSKGSAASSHGSSFPKFKALVDHHQFVGQIDGQWADCSCQFTRCGRTRNNFHRSGCDGCEALHHPVPFGRREKILFSQQEKIHRMYTLNLCGGFLLSTERKNSWRC